MSHTESIKQTHSKKLESQSKNRPNAIAPRRSNHNQTRALELENGNRTRDKRQDNRDKNSIIPVP